MSDLQPHYGLQVEVLEALAGACRYNDWVASLAYPYLGDHPIEIGSGLGDIASFWLDRGLAKLTVSDLEQRSVETLQRRFGRDERVLVRRLDLSEAPHGTHTALVAINVLEHVADDEQALAAAARLVAPGGNLVIFVPAFDLAMSRFDRAIGHYRRYTRDSLTAVLRAACVDPVVVRYVNAPGLVAWLIFMKLLRGTPRKSVALDLWDRTVIPLTRRLEARHEPPFGQSVFAVAATRRCAVEC